MAHNAHLQDNRSNSVYRDELNRLLMMLDSVGQNASRVVEIVGDPGSGKSRLVAALVREMALRNLHVLVGRCAESEKNMILHPFMHILRCSSASQLHDRLPFGGVELLNSSQVEYADLYQSVRALLEYCAEKGMLVVLDDFHHADQASVGLLDHLVRFPVPRLLLVVPHRPRQTSVRLRSAFAHGVELGTVERIQLGPLSIGQSAEILGVAPNDQYLRRLHRQSDGVPAYLLALAETGDHGRLGGPGGAHGHLADRLLGELAALESDERTLLRAAAVIGDRFNLGTLEAIAGLDCERAGAAITGLVARDLVRPSGAVPEYTFRHPMVRRLVYAETDPLWRRSAHRRVLAVLVDQDAQAGELAVHVEQLLQRPVVGDLPLLTRATEQAIATVPASAARWLKVMLRAIPEGERHGTERLRLSLKLAWALAASGQAAQSRELYREMLQTLPAEPRAVRAAAVVLCVQLECALGHYAEAGYLAQEELNRTPADARELTELMLARKFVADMKDKSQSRALTERCMQLARSQGDRINEAGALGMDALDRLFDGDITGAVEAVGEGAAIVDRLADRELCRHAEYLATLGWAELYLDRFADAERHFQRAYDLARQNGAPHHLPAILLGLGATYSHTGPLDEAMRSATESDRMARAMGADHVRSMALAREAACVTVADAGGGHKAVALAEKALRLLPPDCKYGRTDAVLALAEAALMAGDPLRCTALMLDLGGGKSMLGVPLIQRARCVQTLAEAAAASDPASLPGIAGAAAAAADRTGVGSHRGHALAVEAHMFRAQGEHHRALHRYRAAAQVFSRARMDVVRARMTAFAAHCAIELEASDEAAGLLVLARELARRSGAWHTYQQAGLQRRELAHLARGGGDGSEEDGLTELLTTREAEIARLAGRGERTKDIAERLSLSPRTVETHLTHIYRKLRVKSRAALASRISEGYEVTGRA